MMFRAALPFFGCLVVSAASAQLVNGSFEDSNGFTLYGWEWTCDPPTAITDVPPGSGNWSVGKAMGNTQGCWPSYVFQRIPFAPDGSVWTLSGWVHSDTLGTPAFARMGFSSLNNGSFTFQSQIGASAYYWSYVSINDTVHSSATDTAVVLLTAGTIGGPGFGAGWFDGITLAPLTTTGVHEPAVTLHTLLDQDGSLHLSAGDQRILHVQLIDHTGRLLRTHMHAVGAADVVLATSALSAGIYTVRVETSAGQTATRFFKP